MTPEPSALTQALAALNPVFWINPKKQAFAAIRPKLALNMADIHDAAERLSRFAPYLAQTFAGAASQGGLIESELRAMPQLQQALATLHGEALPQRLFMKLDSHLPISGSIKARGGIYEVLKYAETLALASGQLHPDDDYRCLALPVFRELFAQHRIIVGSTGNLGLSIGIMSARLGFKVTVHMSADAKGWKKIMLREQGVEVIEHASDYSVAVAAGRETAQKTPNCYFVDDEDSQTLFLGYSVAALRLQAQLEEQGITVSAEQPLFVYLPCGVGGGPGGVAFGLKQVFGDAVYCFFAEPTHSPSMLLGMSTGLHQKICVQDIGIDNHTCADGLAVGRASGFVGQIMDPLLDGICTLPDERFYLYQALVQDSESVQLEPSAVAGLGAYARIMEQARALGLKAEQLLSATHIAWATGGSLVPDEEYQRDYLKGKQQLEREQALQAKC